LEQIENLLQLVIKCTWVNDVRQPKVFTGESLGTELRFLRLKRYTSPGTDQILSELIQAGYSQTYSFYVE